MFTSGIESRDQGTLSEEEGSVHLASSLKQLYWLKRYIYFSVLEAAELNWYKEVNCTDPSLQ